MMSDDISTSISGLFLLKLKSVVPAGILGAPNNDLVLSVYTPKRTVTGHSLVLNSSLYPPLIVNSHVTGNLIYATVMGPGSKIRIDLDGWPEVNWPVGAGVGPVIPENYTAQILLEPDYSKGIIIYNYRTDFTGVWHTIQQDIVRVDN
jgi:hypothetical protein